MNNIILIGMPASGKSSLGILLAKELGYGFIDSDLVIQAREGRTLSEIIEAEGMEEFLRKEEKINAELCAERCVIATGGSVVYGARAMEHLKKTGTVVYLKLSFPEIERRLSDLKGRGVAIKEGTTLEALYEERIPLYEKYADVTAELDGKDVKGCLSAISEALRAAEEKK